MSCGSGFVTHPVCPRYLRGLRGFESAAGFVRLSFCLLSVLLGLPFYPLPGEADAINTCCKTDEDDSGRMEERRIGPFVRLRIPSVLLGSPTRSRFERDVVRSSGALYQNASFLSACWSGSYLAALAMAYLETVDCVVNLTLRCFGYRFVVRRVSPGSDAVMLDIRLHSPWCLLFFFSALAVEPGGSVRTVAVDMMMWTPFLFVHRSPS
ncbi:hypothetical protein C8J57DRAFT_1533172 [Mycena rebaudengoi]|nr:hypothetical protein C8J57DRAFT_1533172 [Mycena rebaudengoi]